MNRTLLWAAFNHCVFVPLFVAFLFVGCKQSPLSKLHDLRDDMCGCEDIACVQEVYKGLENLPEPTSSVEYRLEIVGVMGDLAECAKELEGTPAESGQTE